MIIAIWIIAVCEVIRIIQNMVHVMTIRHDTLARDNVYSEFVKSLKVSDKAFVRGLLEEFERQEGEE